MNGMIKICEKSVVGEVELTGPVTDILYIVTLGDLYSQDERKGERPVCSVRILHRPFSIWREPAVERPCRSLTCSIGSQGYIFRQISRNDLHTSNFFHPRFHVSIFCFCVINSSFLYTLNIKVIQSKPCFSLL